MSMKCTRTIKLKIDTPTDTFRSTIESYTKAFNYTCRVGWKDEDCDGVSLHKKVYPTTREYFPSQLAISARMKATEALKSVKTKTKQVNRENKWRFKWNETHLNKRPKKLRRVPKCPNSSQASIRYDMRSFNVWFDRNQISLSTVEGRKTFDISIPEYFQQYLSWKRCSADLFVKNNKVFLHIVFEKNIEETPSNGTCIGIDRGIRKLAVTSDKRFFGGGHVRRVSEKYKRLRSILQSKKHSAKRHFRKISSKENRFRRDVNHCISKQIVSNLKPGSTIVFEKLEGIHSRTTVKKKERYQHSSWSFYQLEEFIKYKAEAKGISIAYVDARHTSRGCSRCGYIDKNNREYQSFFRCKKCGYQCNADLNASFNIVNRYLDSISYPDRAVVNQPIARSLA